jgi:hypothetical protein
MRFWYRVLESRILALLQRHKTLYGQYVQIISPGYTLASLISRTAALSTMFLTVKRLMALSFATQREQFEQRTKPTWPRPFLLRPPFLLFLVCQGEIESMYLKELTPIHRVSEQKWTMLEYTKYVRSRKWPEVTYHVVKFRGVLRSSDVACRRYRL